MFVRRFIAFPGHSSQKTSYILCHIHVNHKNRRSLQQWHALHCPVVSFIGTSPTFSHLRSESRSAWCRCMEKPQEGEDEAPSDQGDFTPRDYRDFSREPMAGGTEVPRLPFAHPSQAHFPSQLHLILSQSKAEGYSHICSWQSHGRAFLVRDRQLFVDRVLPLYFRQVSETSSGHVTSPMRSIFSPLMP